MRVEEFAFANSMMFIETSAKTRPVQIHVQRRHRSSSLSCESISKRFWLEPRISQGRQHRCSFNMNQHKFFGSHTDENTRFMLARRALVSAMATASWTPCEGATTPESDTTARAVVTCTLHARPNRDCSLTTPSCPTWAELGFRG